MRLSRVLKTLFLVSFIIWGLSDAVVKPVAKAACVSRSIPVEVCKTYQSGFVVSSVSGYTASTSFIVWLVVTQVLLINPVVLHKGRSENE